MKPFMLKPAQGAAVSLFLATSPDVANASGQYFVKSRPAAANPLARDPEIMTAVWRWTEKMTA